MSRKRNNKARWVGSASTAQPWFVNHVRRMRVRNKIAKASRRRNRV